MRVDVDFESYAAARWHLVVRTLVLLGVPPGHAATLTRQALVRRHPEWSHQDGFDDLDAELYREVLDLKRRDAAAWWSEPAYDDELWVELEPELDRLEPAQREWLVLRHVAELPESYIGAVVGEADPGRRSGLPTGERLREAARMVPVPPPDLEQVVAEAGQRHQRRRRRSLALTGALLAVAGVTATVVAVTVPDDDTSESPPRELAPAPVERATSGSAVGWYADGRLHLSEVTIYLPDLRDVATINDGAVYADDDGDLVHVNDQGQRTLLDSIGDGGTFVASDAEGLVAWVPDDEDAELVVRNLAARSDVLRLPMAGIGRVIAIDAGTVFFNDDTGDHEVTLPDGEVTPEGFRHLVDVARRVRLSQTSPHYLLVEQPLVDIVYSWPGERGQLSEEATFALAWDGDQVTIHDTASGESVAPDVGPDEWVLDAEFGPGNTITYLVSHRSQSNGIVNVRTCLLSPVFLSSGEAAPKCTEAYAGQYRGIATDLLLAR